MDDSQMIEVKVASLGIDSSTQSPIVILKEKEGERYLPIWIGPSEASAIATELAGVKFSRPLTHDLMKTLVKALHGKVTRVVIGALKNNTYYAQILVQNGDEDVSSIDARPSDSIALALRLHAPIFAAEELLDHTAEEVGEVDEEEYDPEALKDHLRRMNPEDFGRFSL
ncbi:MAG TPA: bifunctional nuclease family protein [Gemmatimonadota bacterium]|nr:bifunctional nuclease family protein [Gemmatimonadota bacterium]